jgi:hypothetical protein
LQVLKIEHPTYSPNFFIFKNMSVAEQVREILSLLPTASLLIYDRFVVVVVVVVPILVV